MLKKIFMKLMWLIGFVASTIIGSFSVIAYMVLFWSVNLCIAICAIADLYIFNTVNGSFNAVIKWNTDLLGRIGGIDNYADKINNLVEDNIK